MKQFALIVCLLSIGFDGFSQTWRDSLKEARKHFMDQSYGKAYAAYQQTQKLAPKEIDLSLETAQAAYKAGNFQDAEKLFASSQWKKGNSSEKGKLNRCIGNTQMKQKQYEKAIQSYKKALRINSNDEAARYNLAQALRQLKKQQDKQQQQSTPPQKSQDQKNKPQPNNSNQQPNNSNQHQPARKENEGQRDSEISDEKAERLLDELMKKEIETKKKFEGSRASSNGSSKSRKDW